MTTIYYNPPHEGPIEYLDGSVMIGVATAESQAVQAVISIQGLQRRPGDSQPIFQAGTKGAEVREKLIKKFLASEHDFLLFLDGDMLFPADGLERLRSHGLPCVSGHYVRRTAEPMVIPIWFEDDPDFNWPPMPFRDTPKPGQLYRLGATGFGIWLIHRSVFEAVQPMLKGEAFVWQDDMDVWPYDLQAVLEGREQLRVLRGVKEQVGADVRLSFFIRQAGFPIWGDGAVQCGHFLLYSLDMDDWTSYGPQYRAAWSRGTEHDMERNRAAFDERRVKA